MKSPNSGRTIAPGESGVSRAALGRSGLLGARQEREGRVRRFQRSLSDPAETVAVRGCVRDRQAARCRKPPPAMRARHKK